MALRSPCSGLAPLRHSRGLACSPRTPAARTAGAIFFGGSSLAAPQPPLPSVFHSWGAAALGWGWCLGSIFAPFLSMNRRFSSTFGRFLSAYSRAFSCICQIFFVNLQYN